jgi:hypothetical protein
LRSWYDRVRAHLHTTFVRYQGPRAHQYPPCMRLHRLPFLALVSVALLHCSSSNSSSSASASGDGGDCYPDNDGINDVPSTIDLVVNDTGFYPGSPDSGVTDDAGAKSVITTQNSSTITFTLTNQGTKEHGFKVLCTSVLPAYPDLPSGCATTSCFPSDSTIAPIAPGTSTTITFVTPVPDNLVFPFESSATGDANVPGLNGSEGSGWSLQ